MVQGQRNSTLPCRRNLSVALSMGFLAETDLSPSTITGPARRRADGPRHLGGQAVATAGRSSSGSALLGHKDQCPDWDAAAMGYKSEHMTDVDWQPLPPLWPSPAVSTDVGGFMLLVFTGLKAHPCKSAR